MRKKALITGITGQDGSYLAELLLSKGYVVHGIKRRSSSFNTSRIDGVLPDWHEREARLFLHFADLSDATSLVRLLYRLQPDEIYHLGAQSHEVIDLIRLKAIQQSDQTCGIREIRKVQEQTRFAFMPVGKDAVDAGGIETARPPF